MDDEPSPFWNGADHLDRVERWKAQVAFETAWGSVTAARFNGSSGAWVEQHILGPLGAGSADTWFTDCLDTYRASVGFAKRLSDTYTPFAAKVRLKGAVLPAHPSEGAIVAEALAQHVRRLRTELLTARSDVVVTLGNAALRVLATITEPLGQPPDRLRLEHYGAEFAVRVDGRVLRWLPLAHPGAPRVYREAHDRWVRARSGAPRS